MHHDYGFFQNYSIGPKGEMQLNPGIAIGVQSEVAEIIGG
jgi:hypothetical protein